MLVLASALLPVGLLALLAEAGPIAHERRTTPNPISIPLARRSNLDITARDGSIDWRRAHIHARKTTGKFRRHVQVRRDAGVVDPVDHPILLARTEEASFAARGMPGLDGVLDERESAFARRAFYDPRFDSHMFEAALEPDSFIGGNDTGDALMDDARVLVAPTTTSKATPARQSTFQIAPPAFTNDKQRGGGGNRQGFAGAKGPISAAAASAVPSVAPPSAAALTLTPYNGESLWAGTVTIGNPPQSFVINFDSGSADFIVPSVKCTASACAKHARYDPAASSTSATNTSTLRISYGDGSTASGKVYADTVTIGGLSATGQIFGAALTMSDSFADDAFDGILGMGFQSISTLRAPPFFQTLVAQNKVPSAQFSFKLGTTGSELYLGGANAADYTGSIEWHALSSSSYWVIVGAVTVGGQAQPAISDRHMIIDSGTTYVVAPVLDAAAVWAQVPGSKTYNNGFYTFPCAQSPTISFTFDNGRAWTMDSDNLNLGAVQPGSDRCVGSIVGQDIGMPAWIVGDRFMQGVYTTFDVAGQRVGFANLA